MTPSTPVTPSTPLTLPAGLTLPNRIMKAALSEGLGDDLARPDERLDRLYSRWAEGGYGLVITGNVMVDGRYLGEPGNVVLESDAHAEAFTRWADNARAGGTPVWMQINHPGRQANPITTIGRTVAPSAVGLAIPGIPAPRELTDTEIREIIERFATTASLAQRFGFDGVEIHGAHGYLISQFLSPLANRRTDAWGGSIEARAAFLLEIVRAVRAAVAPGFAVGVKLNSADFQRGGFTEDESRTVISLLADEGIDLLEISGGSYESPAMMGQAEKSARTRAREAYFLDYAATVRDLAPGIPLAVTGGFRTRAGIEEALASGACDVVGIGRPAAVVPDAARALLTGELDTLPTHAVRLPLPAGVGGSTRRSAEGALDLQWHTDQLHRLGAGLPSDADRSLWRTAVTTVQRNGFDALRGSRRTAQDPTTRARRKFHLDRAAGRYVMNPTVAALSRLGLTSSLAAELETIGRRSGQTRVVPVTANFDTTGAWVISQHGMRSGWAQNVAAQPKVRIKRDGRWVEATAQLLPDDDVVARARGFAPTPALAPVFGAAFRAMESDPISVRLTFTEPAEDRAVENTAVNNTAHAGS
ncbi:nitroreductase family deazaflavin-dependent oxidoreductase [Millisia brevis]|uniref:nitroreductase family deazaflavin-dependent oxidoreductase n=1 Tax=Millisia brevis TaxID=264148 RepID=UPI00247FD6EC|nr:nitroreductase family deazaflavin-dependent oxidoreductase [Millisia brevis]